MERNMSGHFRSAFFYDSGAAGKPWSLDLGRYPMSGTDGMILKVFSAAAECGVDAILLSTTPSETPADHLVTIRDLADAYRYCNENKIDFLICVFTNDPVQPALLKQPPSFTRLIVWAQNTPGFDYLNIASASANFHQLVTVSNIQRDLLAHHPIFRKTTAILNFLTDDFIARQCTADAVPLSVAYIGALRASKGFQHLANVWPAIRNAVPGATLHVYGSPGLYSSFLQVGPEGVAETEFEKQILAPLGGTRSSASGLGVIFHGSVAAGTLHTAICQSQLVVVNPNMRSTGSLETFCVSALEASVVGKPVVGGKAGGLIEVVGHNKGGLLASTSTELESSIIRLLKDPELATRLGSQGKIRARRLFDSRIAIARWTSLLNNRPMPETGVQRDYPRDIRFYGRVLIRSIAPVPVIKFIKNLRLKLISANG
ncbi:MAG: glycosyltransferase [Chitinophagaceae bacterium]|nr:MAG: glycosyltransferase [Chitinophagaceae bacterium]